MGNQSPEEKVGPDNLYYGALSDLSGGDEEKEPPVGWTGSVREVAAYFGASVVATLRSMHFDESDLKALNTSWEQLADDLIVYVSPPPKPQNHHGDLKQVSQWRKDAAYRIDPATTRELLRGQ